MNPSMFLKKKPWYYGHFVVLNTTCQLPQTANGTLDDLDPEEQGPELADNDTGTSKMRDRKPIDKAFMSVIAFTVMNSAHPQ